MANLLTIFQEKKKKKNQVPAGYLFIFATGVASYVGMQKQIKAPTIAAGLRVPVSCELKIYFISKLELHLIG